jgi:hypothetical protein
MTVLPTNSHMGPWSYTFRDIRPAYQHRRLRSLLTGSTPRTKLGRGIVTRYARLESRCRNFHGSLRELQDRQNDTENEERVNQSFEEATAFFFRAYQESVSGFELAVHDISLVDTRLYAHRVP